MIVTDPDLDWCILRYSYLCLIIVIAKLIVITNNTRYNVCGAVGVTMSVCELTNSFDESRMEPGSCQASDQDKHLLLLRSRKADTRLSILLRVEGGD